MGMNRAIQYGHDWRESLWNEEGLREVSPVGGGLYLSGDYFNDKDLSDLRVRNVMSVARECADTKINSHRVNLVHFGFRDQVIMDIGMVEAALRSLRAMLRRGTTLVHCGMGISRSPTIIALYWMAVGKVATYEEGIERLKKVRPCVRPNRLVDERVLKVVEKLRRAWAGHVVRVEEGRRS